MIALLLRLSYGLERLFAWGETMRSKKKSKKLRLNRETVRSLTSRELAAVAGGDTDYCVPPPTRVHKCSDACYF